MGRAKRGKGFRKTENKKTVLGSDDEALYSELEQPDPNSRSYFHDEIDDFHDGRDKILLQSEDDESGSEQEEVLALSSDDDDEEGSKEDETDDEEDYKVKDLYARHVQKDEMASDIEDEEAGLPDVKSWGKKRALYYNTDFVDEDYADIRDSDLELAEEEENEALLLQKRLMDQLNDDDFGLDLIQTPKKVSTEADHLVSKDFSQLTKKEKLDLLTKESPELLQLIEDFKTKMTELHEKVLPLAELVKNGSIPPGPGAQYILLKNQLILQYCTNICFYMVLKSRRTPVHNHPIIKRLFAYRKIFAQLEPVEKQLSKEVTYILEMLSQGKQIQPKTLKVKEKGRPALRILKELQDAAKPKKLDKMQEKTQTKVKQKFTEEEKNVLNQYNEVKQKKVRFEDEISDEEMSESEDSEKDKGESEHSSVDLEEEEFENNDDYNEEDMQEDERRGISYQIAKNKGLTPKRKKEYRNPRVRHRMKFKKAKVRRKGQVREPRKELQRYGGEISGIKAGVAKSIKIK